MTSEARLDELEALAKAARPDNSPERHNWPNMRERGDYGTIEAGRANFEFIAAADPAIVLSLVAEVRGARRELADVHALDALARRHGTRLDIPAQIPGFDPEDGSDHLHFVMMPIGASSRRAALEYLAAQQEEST